MRLWTKKAITTILLVVICIASIFVLALLTRRCSAPWYCRGEALEKFPYTVVTGTVDSERGILGLLEIGASRERVESRLGCPLVRSISAKGAERMGFWDPDDVSGDFYDGVFAWVQYNYREAVISITFDFVAFNSKFGGKQKVLLSHRGISYLLSPDLTEKQASMLLRTRNGNPIGHWQGHEFIIDGTGTSLSFDSENCRLRSVGVVTVEKR